MPGFPYIIAGFVAIGIALVIASTGGNISDDAQQTASDTDAVAVSVGDDAGTVGLSPPPVGNPSDAAQGQLVTVAVPDMMCTVSCFPRVREALESDPNVQSVRLGPQKQEGLIDNRQVIVEHGPGFQVETLFDRLVKAGFTENSIVQ